MPTPAISNVGQDTASLLNLVTGKRKGKGGKSGPIGSAFPNVNTFFSGRRIDIKLLEQTARAPPIARSLWQLQLIAFPWFKFKIVPPAGQELDEEEVKKIEPKLEELDRRINTTILCAQAMYDIVTYGSAIFEITWKEDEDGYIVPDVVQRLPAASFRQAPPQVIGNKYKYAVGNILKGIVYDKVEHVQSYWQLQNTYGSTGLPVEIPAEQVIHVKDARSQFVDGEPYLIGITSTIAQLEQVRKSLMQTVMRVGKPRQSVEVGIPPEYLKALEANQIPVSVSSAIPGAMNTPADIMLTDLWDYARMIVEGQNSDQAVVYPAGIKSAWERPAVALNPIEIDQYLIKEAISHIFPRDILEVASQAISTSSAPLLELLKMMVQGWQALCSVKFENELWTKFLELNGYENYRITLEWSDLIPPDDQKQTAVTLQKFDRHVMTLNEARAEMGLPPLEDAPWMADLTDREILEKELTLWKAPQAMQQPGMDMGGFGQDMSGFGEENVPTEEVPIEDEEIPTEEVPLDEESSGMTFQEAPKLNMNLGTFSTSQDLDSQLDDILKGIEPKVLAALGKTKYFAKEGDQ